MLRGDNHPSDAVQELPQFRYAFLTKPQIRTVDAPKYMNSDAEPSMDFVMPPSIRRQYTEYEVKQQRAARLLHRARSQMSRREHLMHQRYPNGILGVDSPFTATTGVYSSESNQISHNIESQAVKEESRRRRLTDLTCSRGRLGYTLLTHSYEVPARKDQKIFQAKIHSGKAENTFDNLFRREKYKYNPERAENLR